MYVCVSAGGGQVVKDLEHQVHRFESLHVCIATVQVTSPQVAPCQLHQPNFLKGTSPRVKGMNKAIKRKVCAGLHNVFNVNVPFQCTWTHLSDCMCVRKETERPSSPPVSLPRCCVIKIKAGVMGYSSWPRPVAYPFNGGLRQRNKHPGEGSD